MILDFVPSALAAYKHIKSIDPVLSGKIKNVIADTVSHPSEGEGEPTPLTGDYKGIWCRRVSYKDILIYSYDDRSVTILYCGSVPEEAEVAKGVPPEVAA